MLASNIVLADALATPVNHTFVPVGLDRNGVYWFNDQSQPSAIGYWRISIEVKVPVAPKGGDTSSIERNYRYKVGLHEPVLEVLSHSASGIAPAPTVAYVPRAFTEYIMAERSNLQDRKHLRKMNAGLQNEAQVVSLVENLLLLN